MVMRFNGTCWLVASLQVHKETLFQIESDEARELYPPQVSLRAHKGACTNTHAYMGSMCVHSPPTLHIPRQFLQRARSSEVNVCTACMGLREQINTLQVQNKNDFVNISLSSISLVMQCKQCSPNPAFAFLPSVKPWPSYPVVGQTLIGDWETSSVLCSWLFTYRSVCQPTRRKELEADFQGNTLRKSPLFSHYNVSQDKKTQNVLARSSKITRDFPLAKTCIAFIDTNSFYLIFRNLDFMNAFSVINPPTVCLDGEGGCQQDLQSTVV